MPSATLVASASTGIESGLLLSEEKIGPRDGAGRTIVVAMSGGVDSAVTALVMRQRGYQVIGINLRLFSPDDPTHRVNACCGIPAMDDARATCALIDVPFYAVNMESEFSNAVIDRFVEDYASGRTPNPCLECNRHVKFRHLVQRARELGADSLATGHYAQVIPADGQNGNHRLLRAVDTRKDQSYVLHTMTQDQLGFVRFPLGNLTKPEVRNLARSFGLPVAEKPESQEICFVGDGSYAEFVSARRPHASVPGGEIVNAAGVTIGQHQGLLHHTVGQRRGLGIGSKEPYYVLKLDTAANRLVVGSRAEATAIRLTARDVTFTSGDWPAGAWQCDVVVRYRGTPVAAEVLPGEPENRSVTVVFTGERPIAAPGQAVVFYRGDEVLGGGAIDHVESTGG